MSTSESNYHYGDLAVALVGAAIARLDAGEADFSLRDLAKDVGVSATATYRHFKSRDELLAAVANEGFRLLDEDEDPPVPEASDALLAALEGYVNFAATRPALFMLMFGKLHQTEKGMPNRTASWANLSHRVFAVTGTTDEADVARIWSAVHGTAALVLSGLIGEERRRDNIVRRILEPLARNPTCKSTKGT